VHLIIDQLSILAYCCDQNGRIEFENANGYEVADEFCQLQDEDDSGTLNKIQINIDDFLIDDRCINLITN
jgi:hypothetical protein